MARRDDDDQRPALGRFRGARYARTWLTMLFGMTMAWLVMFTIASHSIAWVVLVPLAALGIAAIWLVPLTVVTPDGLRLVMRRIFVPWWEVRWVLDPRPGDEQARIELRDGSVFSLPGVPPQAVPGLRITWAQNRVRRR
ncbi:hypothetical protein [Rhodococcus sp. X156]|uniref:hypothetical protein n=1 Tax=Rhodococcus sp. X156 TaxID=2499145 RepID=UPI000FD9A348|nr:hypothetical protein [Rhodococcus sp. X156]